MLFGDKTHWDNFRGYVDGIFKLIEKAIGKNDRAEAFKGLGKLYTQRNKWAFDAAGKFTGRAADLPKETKIELQKDAQPHVDYIDDAIEKTRELFVEKRWISE